MPAGVAGPLLLVQEIPLVGPGAPDEAAAVQPRGRLDHFSYDPATKLIYLACLGPDLALQLARASGRPPSPARPRPLL